MKSFQSIITLEYAFCYWMQHRNIPIWLSSVLSHPSSLTPKAASCSFENLDHFWQDSGTPLQLYYCLVSGSCRSGSCCIMFQEKSICEPDKAKPGLGHSAVGWESRAMAGALPGGKAGACQNNAVEEWPHVCSVLIYCSLENGMGRVSGGRARKCFTALAYTFSFL